MTLIVVPVYKIVSNKKIYFEKIENLIVTPWGIFLLIIPLMAIRFGLKPIFPGYTDWADFFSYMIVFVYGFIFMKNPKFVEIVKQRMWLFLNIGIISNVLLFYFIKQSDAIMQIYMKPEYGLHHLYISVLSAFISFCWVMFFVGLAAKKLNFTHKFLQVANTAILFKFLLIAGTAIPTSVLIYLVVKKFNLLRFLFGLKPETKTNVGVIKELKTKFQIITDFHGK
jgi:hypothetical protein